MQSLHVPASTVQRVVRVVRWLVPSSGALLAGVIFTYRWFGSRASIDDVGTAVGTVSVVASAAQASAFSAESLAKAQALELAALWAHIVATRAELKVLREYGKADAQTRSKYIDEAQAFYVLQLEAQLRTHANNPAEAARLALLAQWRPDRRSE